MVRSFIVILLLAVFFLSGTLYGMDHSKGVEDEDVLPSMEASDNQRESAETMSETVELEEQEKIEQTRLAQASGPQHFTEKMANFLETAVKGFYEVVVEILYQISALFFK